MDNPEKRLILNLIKSTSKAKPAHLQTIADMGHIDSRIVKDYIRDLRLAGEPIGGSTRTGYHYGQDIHDLDIIINQIEKSIFTRMETIKALKQTKLRMTKDKQMGKMF